MFETLFQSPVTMVAGGALISSPIIIHLINRMRFKRIRWAAMEFLLKSQKRNRRRLIIEQLILLLLRILLVLLAGFLLARFIGYAFGVFKPQNTLHVILLDDTPSMGDQWKDEDAKIQTGFDKAKEIIYDRIARNASSASAAQSLVVLRLSALDEPPLQVERLNNEEVENLKRFFGPDNKINPVEVSYVHTDLLAGVRAAQEVFNRSPQDQRMLHIISDFRQRDWSGPHAEALHKALEPMAQAKVRINLVDVAHPYRGRGQQVPGHHDNLAVLDLKAETRIAAREMPVLFTATVANYSGGVRENPLLTVKINGVPKPEFRPTLAAVPPGSSSPGNQVVFPIIFEQTGFNQVSINLEDEDAGLLVDNARYAVVEVRERVPLLVIDGDLARGVKEKGDTFYLQMVFDPIRGAAKGYEVVARGPAELEQDNLDQYGTIFVLNVRQLSDKALANLEAYAREGGGVAFFLGDRVDTRFYNQRLYAGGKGLFPVPLADSPAPPLSEDITKPEHEPELRQDKYQVFLKEENYQHPVFAAVAESPRYLQVYKLLKIRRYFPVLPRDQWVRGPETRELLTLPNRKQIEDYIGRAQSLLDKLPLDDPRFAAYRPGLDEYKKLIRDILEQGYLYELANALTDLLRDPGQAAVPAEGGQPAQPARPNMIEFWSQPEVDALRQEVEKFRDLVQYGDPFMVESRFGKGRVIAVMTKLGEDSDNRAWTDWAGGSIYSAVLAANYVTVMLDLQKYLANAGGDVEYLVGQPAHVKDADPDRYDGRMQRFFLPPAGPRAEAPAPGGEGKPVGPEKDLREQLVSAGADGKFHFVFDEANEPGIYRFRFFPKGEDPSAAVKPEERALAFNIDALAESDLRRASSEELEQTAGGAKAGVVLHGAESSLDDESYHQQDLSEMPWLYLLFLFLLVVEQALAVHLSFHLRGSETAAAGSARPVTA